MKRPMPKLDAPIPGENYTSDTKNYPWHRPPKNQDYVSSVEHILKKLSEPEKSAMALTALESGETILDFVTGTLRLSVANGNMSIDNAILAAGPYARAIEQLAKDAEIDYERGWSEKPQLLTKAKVDAVRGVRDPETQDTAPVDEGPSGFAAVPKGPAPKDVQASMLGQNDDEVIE